MKVYPYVNCCSEGGNVTLLRGCSDDGHITSMIGWLNSFPNVCCSIENGHSMPVIGSLKLNPNVRSCNADGHFTFSID